MKTIHKKKKCKKAKWLSKEVLQIAEKRKGGKAKEKRKDMGEFNSDDHCIYYCGQESLRRNGVAIMVNKRV